MRTFELNLLITITFATDTFFIFHHVLRFLRIAYVSWKDL